MTYDKTNPEWKRYLKLMVERPHLFIPHPDYKLITMDEDVADYEQKYNRKLGVLYETSEHLLVADLVSYNGKLMVKERLVPNTVAKHILIIPIINDRFVLLRKFYHPVRNYIACFPTTFVEADYKPEQYSIQFLKELFGPFSGTAFYLDDIQPNTEGYHCTTSVYAVKMQNMNLEKRKDFLPDYQLMTESQMTDYTVGSFHFLNRDSYTIAAYAMYMEAKRQMAHHVFFREEKET